MLNLTPTSLNTDTLGCWRIWQGWPIHASFVFCFLLLPTQKFLQNSRLHLWIFTPQSGLFNKIRIYFRSDDSAWSEPSTVSSSITHNLI